MAIFITMRNIHAGQNNLQKYLYALLLHIPIVFQHSMLSDTMTAGL